MTSFHWFFATFFRYQAIVHRPPLGTLTEQLLAPYSLYSFIGWLANYSKTGAKYLRVKEYMNERAIGRRYPVEYSVRVGGRGKNRLELEMLERKQSATRLFNFDLV